MSIDPMHRNCLVLTMTAALMAVSHAAARDIKAVLDERQPLARLTSETATLLRRAEPEKPWQVVQRNEVLLPGDLLLGGGGSTLETLNGATRLTLLGDLNGLSPFPIIETAVILNSATDVDLDLTLDRGRVDITNTRASGPARIRLRCRNKTGELILNEPGDRVAVEVYGRWLRGARFRKEPQPGEQPAEAIAILCLHGSVEVRGPTQQFSLKAPPGPALLLGEGVSDIVVAPQHLDKLPAWASTEPVTEEGKQLQAALAKLRSLFRTKSPPEAAEEMARSSVEAERRIGINTLAAMDELARLALVMSTTKYLDVWDRGILALRHWIGRAPGQDQKLFRALQEKGNYSAGEAEIVLNLLHSFSDEDLNRPETYEALLDYLESERLPIRGLAHWHLSRLVPQGKQFGFNPLAPKAERDQAVQQWRRLIPAGKLPPRPEKSDN